MKIGSLVVVIPNPMRASDDLVIKWLPKADGETTYTIKKLYNEGRLATFEEGVIGFQGPHELGILTSLLREVPDVLDEIQDCLKVPLELAY